MYIISNITNTMLTNTIQMQKRYTLNNTKHTNTCLIHISKLIVEFTCLHIQYLYQTILSV